MAAVRKRLSCTRIKICVTAALEQCPPLKKLLVIRLSFNTNTTPQPQSTPPKGISSNYIELYYKYQFIILYALNSDLMIPKLNWSRLIKLD